MLCQRRSHDDVTHDTAVGRKCISENGSLRAFGTFITNQYMYVRVHVRINIV